MEAWLTIATSIASASISAGGVGWAATALRNRRIGHVDRATRLSDTAMKQVDQLQERSEAAERAADRARQRAEAAELAGEQAREMAIEVKAKLREVLGELNMIIRLVHEPSMTLERLRMVVPSPGQNGNHP